MGEFTRREFLAYVSAVGATTVLGFPHLRSGLWPQLESALAAASANGHKSLPRPDGFRGSSLAVKTTRGAAARRRASGLAPKLRLTGPSC